MISINSNLLSLKTDDTFLLPSPVKNTQHFRICNIIWYKILSRLLGLKHLINNLASRILTHLNHKNPEMQLQSVSDYLFIAVPYESRVGAIVFQFAVCRVSINSQMDNFMSVKLTKNVQILWCDSQWQWATCTILDQDPSIHPLLGLKRKHWLYVLQQTMHRQCPHFSDESVEGFK